MSAVRKLSSEAAAPGAAAPLPATPRPAPALGRRRLVRLGNAWLARAAWSLSRTGRLGLAGVALLLAAALFLVSTHLPLAAEVETLRTDLAVAQGQSPPPARDKDADPSTATRPLPARAEMPAILRQLFNRVSQAHLVVDTGRYEINATGNGGVVRYQLTFPVIGPYPQIRAFIDTTLASMPEVALTDLAMDRKSIADAAVEAQIRMTVFTSAAGVARAVKARPASDRVVVPTQASALFAAHSWFVPPPPAPPVEPPPPPAPTAPPFPYTFIGSFTPDGHPPVFFLAQGDRVIDARVGDRLDGVYQFESAAGSELVFVYLPLNVRQIVAAGVSQ